MHATPTQAVPLHTSCALTEDEIDAAIRRADLHNLFGMKARHPARPKPPLRPSGDFYTLVAVGFLLAATYATIWRCTANYATIACDPRIEVCKREDLTMSSVPIEPEAPPQRELYMHEVYSRARLASTDEAVCRYCEGMALLSEPCNGPSPLPVHQLFARIGDKGSPAQRLHEGVALAVMKVSGDPLLYGELPSTEMPLRGFRPISPEPVTLEHAIVWSNIVGLYLAQGARPQAQQFAYELHVLLLELRQLAVEAVSTGFVQHP